MKPILFVVILLSAITAAAVSAEEPAAGKFRSNGVVSRATAAEAGGAEFKTIPEWAALALKARSDKYRQMFSGTIHLILLNHKQRNYLNAAEVAQCRDAALKFLKSKDPNLELTGLISLGFVGTAEDVPLLVSFVDGANGVQAVTALRNIGTPEARKALEALEQDSKSKVHTAVLEALDYLDSKM